MSRLWPFDGSLDTDAARDRLIEASRGIGNAIRETRADIARRADDGADYARRLANDAAARTQTAARTLRATIEERPIEALVLMGLASFAAGWLLQRMRARDEPGPATRGASPTRSGARRRRATAR